MAKKKNPTAADDDKPKEETGPRASEPPKKKPPKVDKPKVEEPEADEPEVEEPEAETPEVEDSEGEEPDAEEPEAEEPEEEPGDEEPDNDGTGGKRPTAEDLAGLGTSQVKGASLGAADGTIEMLLQMAERLPNHAVKYGVEMYGQLTPFANLRNSPLQDSGFSRDYVEQIYNDLLPVYNRAKFILNSVNYAASAQSSAGTERLFVSPTGKSLPQIRAEMLGIMQKIVGIDSKLRSDGKAQIDPGEMPVMPDLNDLPARLWSGSQQQLIPPLGFEFVPEELVSRSLEAYSHFAAMEVDKTHREFQNLCLTYCKKVHQDIRDTYTDVIGFIKDMVLGFKEMATSSEMWDDVTADLKSDLSRKQAALESRLRNRSSEFGRIQEKARAIPKLRRLPDSATGDQQFESATAALEYLSGTSGLNYQLRGTVGDSGGLIAFWSFMSPSLDKLATTIKLLPRTGKLTDYFSFDAVKWELVRKNYETAAAKWKELSAGA